MQRIEIFSILRTVELQEFEYEVDKKGHGGVKIIIENLTDKNLKNELTSLMEKFNYEMIVGQLID